MSITSSTEIPTLNRNDIAIIGIPFDENSSFLRGPAGGPAEIRRQLHCGAANYYTEQGLNLDKVDNLHDVGDISFAGSGTWLDAIESGISNVLGRGARTLSLGGDHSVTWPIIRAYAQKYEGLTILQIDAHPDLYDSLLGSRHSHACPFARIMEEGLVKRLVQLGIRTLNDHQREQAERFGVEIVSIENWSKGGMPILSGPLYLSLDLDGLDPAYAPGVSHHEPGGLSSRQVIEIIQKLPNTLVGADIVELNPTRDSVGITAMLGAKLLKEIAGKLVTSDQ